jgi:hypothetical protein
MNVEFPSKLAVSKTVRVEEMRSGEEVSAMVRLHGIGWGAKRIAQEFGCARNTVLAATARGVRGSCRRGMVMATVDHDVLLATLDRLKLTAIRDQLDTLLDEAARSKMNLREALGFLVSREIARRDERRISMSSKLAQFPFVRELDGFDYEAQPSLDQEQIRELATCRWIAHGDTVLFLGPPGTGKTHLAVSLGREAIRQNYNVQFITAATLVATLAKAHADGVLDKQLTLLSRPKLRVSLSHGHRFR